MDKAPKDSSPHPRALVNAQTTLTVYPPILVLAMAVNAGEGLAQGVHFPTVPSVETGAADDDFTQHWRLWWSRLSRRAADPAWRLELPDADGSYIDEAMDIRDVRVEAQKFLVWLHEWFGRVKDERERLRNVGIERQRLAHSLVDQHVRGFLGSAPSKDTRLTITVLPVSGVQYVTNGDLVMITPELLLDESKFRDVILELLSSRSATDSRD